MQMARLQKKKKIKKNLVQEPIHYNSQINCLLVWTWFEVLAINLLPLLQQIETYGIEFTALISSSPHVQPQSSETQFCVILAPFWVEFSVGACRKKTANDCGAWLGHLALHPDILSSS